MVIAIIGNKDMLLLATKVKNFVKRMVAKNDIIKQLQKEVLLMQGFKRSFDAPPFRMGLDAVESSFPGSTFPTGAIHEFMSHTPEDSAATNGFMAGLLSSLGKQSGTCLWISQKRIVFPPALKIFGLHPDKFIFIDLSRKKDLLWTIEEALKCEALTAVVGELNELTFTESRRLQLAVEQSQVTGFIHRLHPRQENTVACIARWKIRPLISEIKNMPGVGFPKWHVELCKVRNGKPGTWDIQWIDGHFLHVPPVSIMNFEKYKTA
jgi:protein ImuA